MQDLMNAARVSKAWPFQEAQRLLKRYPDGKPGGEPVLFETGYGPSGLPHIGTFQEVLRTTLVRRAYEAIIGARPEDGKTRLVAFSDDMDGLRKVPDNIDRKDVLEANLHKPLSRIPSPFSNEHDSYAAHNNAKLREFLDRFCFDYDFVASSDMYNSGQFDEALKQVLRKNQDILDIMLPTLRAERAATYSPVLPISPETGRVLQVPVEVVDAETGIVRFTDEDGTVVEQSALGGMAKLQWKVDWAMRWYALGVDYEMYGKDLTDSGVQSGRIVKVLGGRKPEGLIYELFLDEKGEKISKSKGNGLTIEEWLTYGTEESLGFYIFPNPKSAKQLHVGVIPRAVDDYWQFRERIPEQELEKAARQSGVEPAARQRRLAGGGQGGRSAGGGGQPAGDLWPAAQSRERAGGRSDRAEPRRLSRHLSRWCRARAGTRCADRLRGRLYARLHRADPQQARAGAQRSRGLARTRYFPRRSRSGDECGRLADAGLRDWKERGIRLRELARLVQGAVSDTARNRPRSTYGQFHKAVWYDEYAANRGGSARA